MSVNQKQVQQQSQAHNQPFQSNPHTNNSNNKESTLL